jgi:hypothetical protein
VRIRIDTPVAGTYTVTHPYGTQVFQVANAADGINYTADIGASNFLSPALGFRGALAAFGPDQVPFLTWPNYANNPALQVLELDGLGQPTGVVLEQYIGDPRTPSPVVGGPNGNVFRVEGPGGIVAQTDLFFVMGKVFDPTVPLVAHVFPDPPPRNLLAVGPVNRVAPFSPTSIVELEHGVTGVDYIYSVGYPIWYQENLGTLEDPIPGVQLTLCSPGDPMCISDPIDPDDPAMFALRTGGEGFWWSADARIELGGGDRALLVLGLEATFGGDESIVDGQQISFGRVRIRIDTNTTGAGTYRVTHPYGQHIFENVPADDRGINYTADIGIDDFSDPDFAFVGALYSAIGPQFLKWTTFDPDPALTDPLLVRPNRNNPLLSNYHVGNPAIDHEVVGSPFGTNFFRVERQDGGDWVVVGETPDFSVSGKIYDPETFQFEEIPMVAFGDATVLDVAVAQSVTINVLENDRYAPPVTVNVVLNPAHGTAVVNADNTVTYTLEDQSFAGEDEFTYNITHDTAGTSNIATVAVTVIGVDDALPPPANGGNGGGLAAAGGGGGGGGCFIGSLFR